MWLMRDTFGPFHIKFLFPAHPILWYIWLSPILVILGVLLTVRELSDRDHRLEWLLLSQMKVRVTT